ncbi:N-acyl homoserine lactonase family protein [Actinoallomurus acaciae]|uniref:N-acyl homoserine lactonase family protein n=1 Tax=Actinoallomurus acaciae TaxID=502577 RepID=A0ABV5YA32_9ACTN
MSDHSIWVLEYGYVDRFPASNLFAAQPNEGHRRMPYCFALVRSADRCVLVDNGFADEATYRRLTDKYGRTRWAAPVHVLDRIGVTAAQVDAVVLTHNHFDHAGCTGAFPNAHVYIQRREIAQYEAALERPRRFEYLTRSCEPGLPALLAERDREGLATYLDGAAELEPGLAVRPAFDTHTAGSQVVAVTNETDGDWVFAGDNVYSYENLEGLHGDGILAPIAMTTGSATGWLAFAEDLLSSVAGDTRRIIPFHEHRIWERFPSHEFDDGLHVAEISLAGGHGSLLP